MNSSIAHRETPSDSLKRRLIGGVVFGFLVLLGLLLMGDIRKVTQQMFAFKWVMAPLALLCTLLNYSLRWMKWHYYLSLIGARNIHARDSLRLFVGGFPLAVTPGKVGEALKGWWVYQKSGTPLAQGIAVVVAERISDGLAVLLLSTLGVIAYPQYWPAFFVLLCLLLGVILISQIRSIAMRLLQFGERVPILRRTIPGMRAFYEGSNLLFKPRSTLLAVSLGAVSWFGEGVGFYLILLGLGLPPTEELFGLAIFILAFSTAIGGISTLPGGLGAVEASVAGMLILLLHTPQETASAATMLIRFATLWFGVTLGLIVWLRSPDLVQLRHDPRNEGG